MGPPEIAMARRQIEIDRDQLRAAIRRLAAEHALCMLDDAIDFVPNTSSITLCDIILAFCCELR